MKTRARFTKSRTVSKAEFVLSPTEKCCHSERSERANEVEESYFVYCLKIPPLHLQAQHCCVTPANSGRNDKLYALGMIAKSGKRISISKPLSSPFLLSVLVASIVPP